MIEENRKKLLMIMKRLDLLLLPIELDNLKLNVRYPIEPIYKRLLELGSIPDFVNLEAFIRCCKEYHTEGLGYIVDNDTYLIRTKVTRDNTKLKF